MEMRNLGDALIGDLETGVGISVEERRRLSIGMELVAKPQILFLDGNFFKYIIHTMMCRCLFLFYRANFRIGCPIILQHYQIREETC